MAKLVTNFVRRTLPISKHRKISRPAMRVGLVKKRNELWGAVNVELVELYKNDHINMVCRIANTHGSNTFI